MRREALSKGRHIGGIVAGLFGAFYGQGQGMTLLASLDGGQSFDRLFVQALAASP